MDHVKGKLHQDELADAVDYDRQSLHALINRVSIDFLNVKPDLVDDAIDRALKEVCSYLGAGRGFVLLWHSDASDQFHVARDWSCDGRLVSDLGELRLEELAFPWLSATLLEEDAANAGGSLGWPTGAQLERAWFNACGIQSVLAVPLTSDKGLIGAFCIGAVDAQFVWPDYSAALLRIVGDIVVTGRERKAAHAALQRRIAAEEVIRSIATLVIRLPAYELNDGYDRALEVIGQFLDVDRCYIRLSGLGESANPHLAAWRADHSAEFAGDMQDFDVLKAFPSVADVLAQNENIIINSLAEIPEDAVSELDILKRFNIQAAIITSIKANESLVGVLVAEMNHASREWSDIDVMLVGIAAQILGGMRVRQMVDEERRRLETQVQYAQKLESMGVFAGGIAHDFNNLLVGILGNAELLIMDAAADLPSRKKLEQIEASARRAGDLVNQLLTYTGKGHFKIEPLDASTLVSNLTTLVRTVIPKKIDVHSELEDGLPLVAGDEAELRQVIMNLITNAADAIGESSGKILLFTGFGTFESEYLRRTIAGAGLESGDYVIIEVTDTGCGMDEETKARIFDPFFTTKFAGRGLGLAATLGIVRAHHGTINVMSWPQKGTTMQVFLPATAQARVESSETVELDETSRDGGTVLVIDDEVSVRRVTQSVLEHFGYVVMVAENGMRGLRVLEQNPKKVDLVILDMSMPKMDGEETLRRIRELGEKMPVMLTSGYTEVEIHDRFGGLDAAAFIGKPFSPKDLIQEVRKLL